MEKRKYKSSVLIKRFMPYYKPHVKVLCLDLFCAALTTICEIVLPLIIRHITNQAMEPGDADGAHRGRTGAFVPDTAAD